MIEWMMALKLEDWLILLSFPVLNLLGVWAGTVCARRQGHKP